MEQVLEHDPGHVRTREHYEAMVREARREEWLRDTAALKAARAAPAAPVAAA